MTTTTSRTAYRWNTSQAAADYDAAAPVIHPCYEAVQEAVLSALPFAGSDSFQVIDLGGGSGRLAERLLTKFPSARVTIVDPSEPFLGLAQRRLARFGNRVEYAQFRAQEPWEAACETPDAIVSTSALHHLDAREKSEIFARCYRTLAPGGTFINGDEYRPPSDVTYREMLQAWGEHMETAAAIGSIPTSFRAMIAKWRQRNLDEFGTERTSGDDCHETIEEQTARLYGAGFREVKTTWQDRLWAVLVARA